MLIFFKGDEMLDMQISLTVGNLFAIMFGCFYLGAFIMAVVFLVRDRTND